MNLEASSSSSSLQRAWHGILVEYTIKKGGGVKKGLCTRVVVLLGKVSPTVGLKPVVCSGGGLLVHHARISAFKKSKWKKGGKEEDESEIIWACLQLTDVAIFSAKIGTMTWQVCKKRKKVYCTYYYMIMFFGSELSLLTLKIDVVVLHSSIIQSSGAKWGFGWMLSRQSWRGERWSEWGPRGMCTVQYILVHVCARESADAAACYTPYSATVSNRDPSIHLTWGRRRRSENRRQSLHFFFRRHFRD